MATRKTAAAAKKKGGSGSKRSSKSTGRNNNRAKSKPGKTTTAAARNTEKRRRRSRVARQQPEIAVRRSSGRVEKFDPDKLAQTTSRAGTPFLMARDIAKTVSKKVAATAAGAEGTDRRRKGGDVEKERVVEGAAVREMVRKELVKRNEQDIASSLAGERPESTRQGRHEMLDKNEPVLDNTAANRTRLTFDSSTHFARSTKVQNGAGR